MKDIRNQRTSITQHPSPDENHGEEFEVCITHECWTGAVWLPIRNTQGFYTRADAEAFVASHP